MRIRQVLQATTAAAITMMAMTMISGQQVQAQVVRLTLGRFQVKDALFAGTDKFAQGASDVTDVNLGPDMLGLVSLKNGGDLAHKMNFVVVRTYTYPKAGMYKLEDVEAYRQKLQTGDWNCFVHTYESKSGESTDICRRPTANNAGNEMVIITVEPKELTFIHMSGNVSLTDLGKMGAAVGEMPQPPTPR